MLKDWDKGSKKDKVPLWKTSMESKKELYERWEFENINLWTFPHCWFSSYIPSRGHPYKPRALFFGFILGGGISSSACPANKETNNKPDRSN